MLKNGTGNQLNLLEALQILVEPIDNANSKYSLDCTCRSAIKKDAMQ
jgi:hypothetical protein